MWIQRNAPFHTGYKDWRRHALALSLICFVEVCSISCLFQVHGSTRDMAMAVAYNLAMPMCIAFAVRPLLAELWLRLRWRRITGASFWSQEPETMRTLEGIGVLVPFDPAVQRERFYKARDVAALLGHCNPALKIKYFARKKEVKT